LLIFILYELTKKEEQSFLLKHEHFFINKNYRVIFLNYIYIYIVAEHPIGTPISDWGGRLGRSHFFLH